jgi:5'-3' exoribonuclease 1
MGVPGLASYYYKKYNKTSELSIDKNEISKINPDYLFFDYNSLIHPCAQQILSINKEEYLQIKEHKIRNKVMEDDIINNCIRYTSLIILNVDPKNVIIAIDGIAPRSKMNQQRERRYKSEFFSVETKLWDSNKITPGTNFMEKLSDKLKNFDFKLPTIILDANLPGEGEHKIMKIISSLESNKKILIYALDADLLFLSLLNVNCDNVVLIRDNSFNEKVNGIIDYINIKTLKHYISEHIYNYGLQIKGGNFKNECKKSNIIVDYILLGFLLGNDFLESLPSVSINTGGIDTVIKVYINAWKGQHLVKSDFSINLTFLKDVFYQLKNHEGYFFKNFKYTNLANEEISILNGLNGNLNGNLNGLNGNSTLEFYDTNLIYTGNLDEIKKKYYTFYNNTSLKESCFEYIEGLYWILGYYNGHSHNNWNWYYKKHNVPFCSDLFEYLRTNLNELPNLIKGSEYLIKSEIYSNIKQLCLVLPKNSLINILSENGNNNVLVKLKSSLLQNKSFYPNKLFIDLINKRFLWQSKILFENINQEILDYFLI